MEQINIVETETIITYELYRTYYLFSLFKGKLYKQMPRLIFSGGIFGIIVSLFSVFSFGFEPIRIIIPVTLTVVLILMTYLLVYFPKKYYNSASKVLGSSIKYKFTRDYFYAESNGESASGSSQIKYDALYKAYETDEMVYIFIDNRQAYPLEKKNFNSEDFQQLREVLQNKLGKMYYKYS
jgi:hypothetical protein